VTLVSDTDSVLTEFSAEASRVAGRNMGAQGVELRLCCKPVEIAREGRRFRVEFTDGPAGVWDRVLLATGRDASLGALGDVTVDLAGNGTIAIDDRFATSRDGVYAIGDVADRLPLTPVAVADGKALAQQLFGDGAVPVDTAYVATAAFLLPPVAEVGSKDESLPCDTEAYEPLHDAIMARTGERAMWSLRRVGDDGRLVGVTMLNDGAHEAISWAAQGLLHHPDAATMKRALAVHPSAAEEAL
jgi:glutathione reductase (NADPH)